MDFNRRENDEITKRTDKDGKVRRPMNAFMIWSKERRRQLSRENPGVHNSILSKKLGREWATMSENDRTPFIDEAKRIRDLHMAAHPDYRYKPKKKVIQFASMEELKQYEQATMQPQQTNLQPQKTNMQLQRTTMQPQPTNFQPQERDMQPQEANMQRQQKNMQPLETNLQPQGTNLQPQGTNLQSQQTNMQPSPDDYWKWLCQQAQALYVATQPNNFPSLPTPPHSNPSASPGFGFINANTEFNPMHQPQQQQQNYLSHLNYPPF